MTIKKKTRKKDAADAALDDALAELQSLALSIKVKESFLKQIEAEELQQAAEKSRNLFLVLQGIAKATNPPAAGLVEYLDEVIDISAQLRDLATKETSRFASPNVFMQTVIAAFEVFSHKVASQTTRERLRSAASFIPVIEGVVTSCGGIPYYFEHANRYEKATMILSAVLLLTALAMTIAIYTSPAIAIVPLLAPAIAACVTFSRILYDQAAINAKKRYEAKPIVTAVKSALKEDTEKMQAFKKNAFPARVNADLRGMQKTEKAIQHLVDETFVLYGQHNKRHAPS